MFISLILLAATATAPANEPAVNPLDIVVQCREVAFSRSVEAQNIEAFQSFLDADVRFASGAPLRGPAAVVEGWKTFFDPDGPRIRWWPDKTEVRKSGKLALSQGPFEMTITNEEGTTYLAGRFMSVWQANDDGEWKIIFDTGTGTHPIEEPIVSPWGDAAFAEKCSDEDA